MPRYTVTTCPPCSLARVLAANSPNEAAQAYIKHWCHRYGEYSDLPTVEVRNIATSEAWTFATSASISIQFHAELLGHACADG